MAWKRRRPRADADRMPSQPALPGIERRPVSADTGLHLFAGSDTCTSRSPLRLAWSFPNRGPVSPPGMGVPLFNAKENPMFTVPMSQTLRRVPTLLGGAAVHYAPSMPRHAVPALLRPLPSAQTLLASGRRAH